MHSWEWEWEWEWETQVGQQCPMTPMRAHAPLSLRTTLPPIQGVSTRVCLYLALETLSTLVVFHWLLQVILSPYGLLCHCGLKPVPACPQVYSRACVTMLCGLIGLKLEPAHRS